MPEELLSASETVSETVPVTTAVPPLNGAAPVPPSAEALDGVKEELSKLQALVAEIQERVVASAGLTNQVAETQQLGAEQLRRFGRKLDQITGILADQRFRDLAGGLLLFYDLLTGLVNNQGEMTPEPRVFQMLLGQMQQLLTANGIQMIPAEGRFDFQIHRPVKQVPASSPGQDGQIVEVWRAGFRIGDQVMRPRDVVIASVKVGNTAKTDPAC